MANRITIFHCDPWASLMRQLELDTEREAREHELEADLTRELQLSRRYCPVTDEWPWYADPPTEASDLAPQIFGAELAIACPDIAGVSTW